MYVMPKHPKRPRDANQLGKFIVDLATGRAVTLQGGRCGYHAGYYRQQ
jgi:hypothetical protein